MTDLLYLRTAGGMAEDDAAWWASDGEEPEGSSTPLFACISAMISGHVTSGLKCQFELYGRQRRKNRKGMGGRSWSFLAFGFGVQSI